MKALIGRKIGMSQIIDEDGRAFPVTVVEAGPCTVTQVKSEEIDGYSAIQVAFGSGKDVNKAQTGHLKSSKVENPFIMKEFRRNDTEEASVGASFDVSVFETGDKVNVQSTSKGKGFAGTVKRHNFNTGPKTHGSRNYRKPGSIGSMYPQKIFKGKKMAGQMGAATTTVKNQTIQLVDKEKNLLGIVGSVPGPRGSIVSIEGVA